MEQSERIQAWWDTLDEPTHQRILKLEGDEALPADIVPGMVDAHVLVVGTKWPADDGYSFHQPESLITFLADQREEE
ncbi:hypothetical protein [Streptomyces sp. CLCI03]